MLRHRIFFGERTNYKSDLNFEWFISEDTSVCVVHIHVQFMSHSLMLRFPVACSLSVRAFFFVWSIQRGWMEQEINKYFNIRFHAWTIKRLLSLWASHCSAECLCALLDEFNLISRNPNGKPLTQIGLLNISTTAWRSTIPAGQCFPRLIAHTDAL